jgi:hypothetical protein
VKRSPAQKLRDEAAASWECLEMVRARLEALGMSMKGCPPMFYDDAVANLAQRLGRKAGLTTWEEVRAVVAEGNT